VINVFTTLPVTAGDVADRVIDFTTAGEAGDAATLNTASIQTGRS
jgi:hypothetical protein